jgi:hypothetical protein
LSENSISRQTAHRYQALAAVPREVLEAALADGEGRVSAKLPNRASNAINDCASHVLGLVS